MHLKEQITHVHLFIRSSSWVGIMWLVFPSSTTLCMRLPDSASIFTAEIGAIIKALEQIKDYVAFKYIVFKDSLSDSAAKSALELPHANVSVPILILNIVLAYQPICSFHWRTSFILSSQLWEIGSSPTGGAGSMKLFCVVPASIILI